jgi:hypothetical protein
MRMLALIAATAAALACAQPDVRGDGSLPDDTVPAPGAPGTPGAPTPVDTAPPGTTARDLVAMEAEIRKRVGEARAERAESCRTIAFGAKPCGGPWSYLVYSTEATDEARLRALVEEYNAREARLNQEEGRMSDCALVARPEVELRGGRCVAVGGG